MRATLVVPDRDASAPSGGDRYDARLAEHWPGPLLVRRAPGAWPWPDQDDLRGLAGLLATAGGGPVLVDGLVGCAAPEVVAASARERVTAVLVHSTLTAGSGAEGAAAAALDAAEGQALRAADLVVTTSAWSAHDLATRYGLRGVVVARPGQDEAPVATGSSDGTVGTPQLLVLAALTPGKNHAVLLEALAGLVDRPWTAVVAGPAPDPSSAAELRAAARRLRLEGRVTWPGALVGERLEEVWDRTDLLVHPSRSETWGLVVTEALARGIPAVVGRGTGAAEALTHGSEETSPPGASVDVHDPAGLREGLRGWLDHPSTRRAWREAALRRRDRPVRWEQTASTVAAALAEAGAARAGTAGHGRVGVP